MFWGKRKVRNKVCDAKKKTSPVQMVPTFWKLSVKWQGPLEIKPVACCSAIVFHARIKLVNVLTYVIIFNRMQQKINLALKRELKMTTERHTTKHQYYQSHTSPILYITHFFPHLLSWCNQRWTRTQTRRNDQNFKVTQEIQERGLNNRVKFLSN